MTQKSVALLALLALPLALAHNTAQADGPRNYLYVVGSTTVAPFTEEVAKHIKGGKLRPPLLESNGTSGGFTMFCEGVGMDYPDIVNASRPIKKKELETCTQNGAGEVLEVKFGFDGLVVASQKKAKPMDLTRKDLYLALAKNVPDPACKGTNCDNFVPNPYKTWKQVNPALPDAKIEVYGPPLGSGSAEVFGEAVSEVMCDKYPSLAAKKLNNEKEYKRTCDNVRADGVYVEETGEMITSRLDTSPNAVGIINFSRFKDNDSHLQAATLDGVLPSYDTLATQTYPISRPLYFYAKLAHVNRIPGFGAFLTEFTNEKTIGPKGYLLGKGLIAMPLQDVKTVAADVKALKTVTLDSIAHH